MPTLPPVPQVGLDESQKCGTGVLDPVDGQYKRIVPMLDYARHKILREGLICCVKLVHHDVTTTPPHKTEPVCFESGEQESHGSSHLHGMHAFIFVLETNL